MLSGSLTPPVPMLEIVVGHDPLGGWCADVAQALSGNIGTAVTPLAYYLCGKKREKVSIKLNYFI